MISKTAAVIGAGPAGLSAAIGLLRAGFRVQVMDQRTQWKGRVCGAFYNNEAIAHLQWLEVYDEMIEAGATAVTTAHISTVPENESKLPLKGSTIGIGLPRFDLERILTSKIERLGGAIQTGCRVRSVQQESDQWLVQTKQDSTLYDTVVLADGRSTLALEPKDPFAATDTAGWYGCNSVFEGIQQGPDQLSLHFFPRGYVGLLSFRDGTTNVCGLYLRNRSESTDWNEIFESALKIQSTLRRHLNGARRISDWQGVGPLPYKKGMRQSEAVLVGDAAAVGDPYMGEGNGRALGAGPMIYQSLMEIQFKQLPLTRLNAVYTRLWKDHYNLRLRVGRWLRTALGSSTLFPVIHHTLLTKPRVSNALRTTFHTGFSPRYFVNNG